MRVMPVKKPLFYHVTSSENATAILDGGFKDGTPKKYMTDRLYTGVWITDDPEKSYGGGHAHPVVLEIKLRLDAKTLANYEWVDEGGAYREWCIPAAILNKHSTIALSKVRV
jgi:hypothetical protein